MGSGPGLGPWAGFCLSPPYCCKYGEYKEGEVFPIPCLIEVLYIYIYFLSMTVKVFFFFGNADG